MSAKATGSPFWGVLAAVLLIGAGPAVSALLQTSASAAVLASAPSFRLPEGCTRPAPEPFVPAPAFRFPITCGEHVFDVAVTAFPARSSPNALAVARRRATQELGAEDVSVTPIHLARADKGRWTLVETSEPNRATAYSIWMDGNPAADGLAGRLAQARTSLFGANHAPVLITISTAERQRVSAQERQSVADVLRTVVDAQSDLGAEVERLSRLR